MPASKSINLYTGWNLVGYPTMNSRYIESLTGTGFDKVECFDPASAYLLKQMVSDEFMEPGNGYWVHVPADTVWTINW